MVVREGVGARRSASKVDVRDAARVVLVPRRSPTALSRCVDATVAAVVDAAEAAAVAVLAVVTAAVVVDAAAVVAAVAVAAVVVRGTAANPWATAAVTDRTSAYAARAARRFAARRMDASPASGIRFRPASGEDDPLAAAGPEEDETPPAGEELPDDPVVLDGVEAGDPDGPLVDEVDEDPAVPLVGAEVDDALEDEPFEVGAVVGTAPDDAPAEDPDGPPGAGCVVEPDGAVDAPTEEDPPDADPPDAPEGCEADEPP